MANTDGGLSLSFGQDRLLAVRAALKEAANGKTLQRQLTKELKAATGPIIRDMRAGILSMPTKTAHPEPLNIQIANQIKASVSYSGIRTGVSIKVPKNKYPRNFQSGPYNMNAQSFRHPLFGNTNYWQTQVGKPNWFDAPALKSKEECSAAIMVAIQGMIDTIVSSSNA